MFLNYEKVCTFVAVKTEAVSSAGLMPGMAPTFPTYNRKNFKLKNKTQFFFKL